MRAILLSGGIESAALAYWHKPEVAVTVDYGQLAAAGEIRAARALASEFDLEHLVVTSDAYLAAPPPRTQGGQWWPYRNQLLITLAAISLAERGLSELLIGVVRGDIYKDCTPEFMRAVTDLMLIQENRVLVMAPAVGLTTIELLQKSGIPNDYLGVTLSCHFADIPCGFCAGCRKSRRSISEYARLSSQT